METFLDTWQFEATDFERTKQQNGWIELLRDSKAGLRDLIDATIRRRKELKEPEPDGFLLYVDQGEELYIRAEEGQRRRFSELLAQALPDHRLRTMMSMRADFLGALQADKPLFNARLQIDVPPLGEDELREVISRPAQLLGARFENDRLIEVITRRTVEDSVKDVGALPLLSYTLDDMWTQMQAAQPGDGILRLPAPYFELGRVLVDRANSFLATHPDDESALRRILTLKLATLREGEEPTRRARCARNFPRRNGISSASRQSSLSSSRHRAATARRRRGACRAGRGKRGRDGVERELRAGRTSGSAWRNLRGGRARGVVPTLGSVTRVGCGRARISGVAQRRRSGAAELAIDASSREI